MATRKLIRDLLLSKRSLLHHQGWSRSRRLPLVWEDRRRYSVFNEFSKNIKGQAVRNQEFQQSVKELKEKADELKGVKEELKERTKQKTEKLYKQVDEAWTEAEAAAKKVSYNVKEKISAASEEVKETFGIGKQDSSGSTDSSTKQGADANGGNQTSREEEKNQQSGSSKDADSLFGKFKSTISSPNVSAAFQKLKDAKLVDITKKGYDIVKEELSSTPTKRKRVPFASSGETSTRTDLVVMPSKQSWWSKKFDEFREKVKGHPVSKRFLKYSDPVKTKGQEVCSTPDSTPEETSSKVAAQLYSVTDSRAPGRGGGGGARRCRSVTGVAASFGSQPRRGIAATLGLESSKGDVETLKKYCSPELIERCKAEHNAYQSHGIFFDNKILHVSDLEIRETKMMGSSPVIIVMDTIHTVFYFWALQQMDQEDRGEDVFVVL
ncbi:hypothetical protein JHK87_009552 [Glycine soja]|nr:hypothetical protein JHK87_009552 [Glycine soja]